MASEHDQPLILVVDDDAGQRLVACESLLQAGFAVVEAADGEHALRLFRREQPDLVLLDVVMPGLDGFAVCETMRQSPGGRHVPVVMVTGLDDVESFERAYEVGATDFITKPIQWLVLHHRVRYILRASQAVSELRESEERFRTLVQAAGSVILVLDRQERLMEFNRAAGQFCTCRRNEPLGPKFQDLGAKLSSWGDLEASRTAETTVLALDGTEHTLLWTISPFRDPAGIPAGWVMVGHDITARRQAEQTMRTLTCAVEQNPVSILVTDTHGIIEYANPKFSEVSGYSHDEILGNTSCFLQTNTPECR